MIDFNKFAKYSKPGPRYTSYPTALEFSEKFDNLAYIEALGRHTNLPLSLYTHLPFCKSACYFCGCSVIYTSKDDKKTEYIKYLKKELDLLKNHLDTNRSVLQFHFGGGTPTFFDAKSLEIIIQSIYKIFSNFARDAEISCEIDPRFFNEDQMKVLKDYGFNRLSFGVQDFDMTVQTAIHRVQPFDLVESAVNLARKYGIECINFDLIYGLPNQNLASFKETLESVVKIKPTRLAVFNYAHVPWIKKTMRKIDENLLPPPSDKLSILKYTIEYLSQNGYKMIGMDHFALESDELYKASLKGELKRNFQGYTAKKHTQTIGLGVTSIGEGHDYYVQNHKDYATYMKCLDSGILPVQRGIKLNDEDILRKNIIMRLMNNFVLDIKHIEEKFNINFKEHFKDSLEHLQEYVDLDLMTINDKEIRLNQTGSMLVRNIVMVFDEYLGKIPIGDRKFSKTV
ncbi:oxygen-independent coproporphyrinogen III oxidase [Helicobacter sp. 16-1353]|uniref:oxygen-independent coproporphyrinogen III oxidase n=1 Tax=Helicobacter sp. 16-1353 TaxID=2004996 RepID=UPI000DCB6836|nr:oxygen-independent coproporphyrinogen III oxidase [Helicobacter sp. 16-1353]RAX54756.1 oxygen-independent coproporphyrinogen III oxidase [Helicobacter sp. 16-1353]